MDQKQDRLSWHGERVYANMAKEIQGGAWPDLGSMGYCNVCQRASEKKAEARLEREKIEGGEDLGN